MYNQITETLKKVSQTNLIPTITIDSFCKIPNQVAFVCRHFPCMIPGYHDHDCFEINYIKLKRASALTSSRENRFI